MQHNLFEVHFAFAVHEGGSQIQTNQSIIYLCKLAIGLVLACIVVRYLNRLMHVLISQVEEERLTGLMIFYYLDRLITETEES